MFGEGIGNALGGAVQEVRGKWQRGRLGWVKGKNSSKMGLLGPKKLDKNVLFKY
jgi:hypothetical protein